jgi:hypothetical protein
MTGQVQVIILQKHEFILHRRPVGELKELADEVLASLSRGWALPAKCIALGIFRYS